MGDDTHKPKQNAKYTHSPFAYAIAVGTNRKIFEVKIFGINNYNPTLLYSKNAIYKKPKLSLSIFLKAYIFLTLFYYTTQKNYRHPSFKIPFVRLLPFGTDVLF